MKAVVFSFMLILFMCNVSYAWEVGSVDTEFKLFGANHKVVVTAFKDPDYDIVCHVSQAKTGGVSGSVGLAEDPSNFSINCIKNTSDEIKPKNTSNKPVKIFSEKTSFIFKSTDIYRMYDEKTNSFVYLAVSTKVINGSPKNSISSVSLNK